jgi:hypothetical protein
MQLLHSVTSIQKISDKEFLITGLSRVYSNKKSELRNTELLSYPQCDGSNVLRQRTKQLGNVTNSRSHVCRLSLDTVTRSLKKLHYIKCAYNINVKVVFLHT